MHIKTEILKKLEDLHFSDTFFDDARNDEDIALAAIKKDPQYYHLLGWEAQSNPKIVKAILKKDGNFISSVPLPFCHQAKYISLANS